MNLFDMNENTRQPHQQAVGDQRNSMEIVGQLHIIGKINCFIVQ